MIKYQVPGKNIKRKELRVMVKTKYLVEFEPDDIPPVEVSEPNQLPEDMPHDATAYRHVNVEERTILGKTSAGRSYQGSWNRVDNSHKNVKSTKPVEPVQAVEPVKPEEQKRPEPAPRRTRGR